MLGPDDHTKEFPIVGHAQVPLPVTAIPYTEPHFAPPPPPPKRRGGLFYLAIAAVLVIVCAGGALAGLTFGADLFRDIATPLQPSTAAPSPTPPPQQDTPTKVAEKFLGATVANDQEAARGYLCRLLRGEGGQTSGGQQAWLSQLVGFKVTNESINGPTASVDVELTVPILGQIPFGLYLIKEDGWKVCGFGLS